jgi:phosphopantothenoylcysteine decarboxylase/phosphopantothenate--cysteine ligase
MRRAAMPRILLVCGASAALHKAADLASKLAQRPHQVRAVLTPRAAELVSPQLFEALTGEPAQVSEFGPQRRGAMDHIELAKWAELVLVAPASADLVSRLALGLADDLASTVCLALSARTPRLIAPAMNPAMLESPPIVRNLGLLREAGWRVLEPASGPMACRDEGRGRLPEPAELAEAVERALGR